MDMIDNEVRASLTPEEKKRQLYERQKAMLQGFLERNAISKEQYDKSLGDLTVKMGYENDEKNENNQPSIEKIIRETTDENQSKTDWTKAWSTKYPILKTYQAVVDIPQYAQQLRTMLTDLQDTYGYSEQDAMLVLKDILAHEYMDNRKK